MSAVLSARDVAHAYDDAPVLEGVSLDVAEGELVALLGPNGAGKTTLLRVLAGLVAPRRGRVEVAGERARSIAYLAQNEPLPLDWTARELVALGRLPHVRALRRFGASDADAVTEAMRRTETLALADRLVSTLSGGERQRVALARALAQEPRVLLLDEPANHLDVRHRIELMATLRAEASRGKAIVAVLHDLGLAAHADRCVLLSGGRIASEGRAADVLEPGVLRSVYDADFERLHTADGRVVVVPVGPPPREPAR